MGKIENKLIEFIKSLDRIMDTWDKLTLRRSLLVSFTIILFSQIIITSLFWIFGRDVSGGWCDFLTLEFGAFSVMLGFYFYNRGKNGGE